MQAPRMDALPLTEVSYAEYKASKREEKRNLKRNLKVKKVGEKKLYLQERGNRPALAKTRGEAKKTQRSATFTHLFSSSSSKASGGDAVFWKVVHNSTF